MVKKLKPLKLSKNPEVVIKLIDSVSGVFKQAAAHPSTLGLCNMTLATMLRMLLMAFDSRIGVNKMSLLEGECTGLYNGSQAIAQASIIVPIIPQVIGNLGEIAATFRPGESQ